jgi:hypothetical protein
MAAVAVSFDGTRVNAADTNTNWGNYNIGGPAPAAEAQLAYQNSLAVNKKITSTAGRAGVDYDPGAGAIDMTAAAFPLAFLKGYVADFGDLNATYGCEFALGSGNAAYYDYNVAGSGANRAPYTNGYPAQGGYILAAINPTIAAWREGTTGSPPVLTAVDYFAFAAQFVVGGAKSENVAMDAIDIGRGLLLVGGDGVSTDGTFIDFLTFDQDTTTNRWGVVSGVDPVVNARGLLTIGSATETDFDDSTSTVIFQDGYHGPGDVGVKVDLANASSVINVGCTLLGLGSSTTSDTRPDFTVTGTSGASTIAALMTNFRNIVLTSAVTVDGADLQFADLAVSSAEIKNSTLRTTSATTVAAINDAAFGTTSGIHDTDFIQEGAGHAIEITTPGTYNFTNINFTGYGADASDAAAIYNNSGGAVTINVAGGNTPTYKNGASATTTVNNTVTLAVQVNDTDANAISGARVRIENASTGALVSQGSTNASGTYTDAGYSYSTDLSVTTKVRLKGYKNFRTGGTITSTGISVGVTLANDTIVDLP